MIHTELKNKYEQLKIENPKIRIRDAAKTLGVSEADLVNNSDDNIRLKTEFENILNDIKNLGYVMALTRNDNAVHERKGQYTKASFNGHIGLIVNPDIDLRLFMYKWKFVFAVNENERQSIQFFDAGGTAIHKIYLTEKSNRTAYDAIVEKYKLQEDAALNVDLSKSKKINVERPDDEVNIEEFQNEWLALKDTHNFFSVLRKHEVTRRQSMRLAPEGHAIEISIDKIEKMLMEISQKDIEFMVFVGNGNCIQIHTGKAKNIVRTGPWINVLDPEFNLHLRDTEIESSWIVKKPTDLGLVHSIECYDKDGELVVQFFGKRKPNIPEREDWREVIKGISN